LRSRTTEKLPKIWKSTILLPEVKYTSNGKILDYYICYKIQKMFTKAERKAHALPLVSLTDRAALRPLFSFSLASLQFCSEDFG
jgi:hypothetical protein